MSNFNELGCGAAVAQRTVNPLVVGSNPTTPATFLIVNILSENFQKKTILKTVESFNNYWNEVSFCIELLEKFKKENISKRDFVGPFLNGSFHPLKVYLTQFTININFISELISEELEEDLFDFWESSEFTSLFFNYQKDFDVIDSSVRCLDHLINHLISYHFLCFQTFKLENLLLKPLPEVGDHKNKIFCDISHCYSFSNIKSLKDGFISINIQDINKNEFIQKNLGLFKLRYIEDVDEKTSVEIEKKVSHTLKYLEKLSPELFTCLKSFSHTFIGINVPGMVSFSLQSLPGYSSINFFERDRIDCFDDLIHENGHHYLNYILNSSELIEEDNEKDYFSPWRMTFRPLRGIYHGVFTFYWALKLFSDLSSHPESKKVFTESEMEKIKFRFVEEYYRLQKTKPSIKSAIDNGAIYPDGIELINHVYQLIDIEENDIKRVECELNDSYKKEIDSLKKSLES